MADLIVYGTLTVECSKGYVCNHVVDQDDNTPRSKLFDQGYEFNKNGDHAFHCTSCGEQAVARYWIGNQNDDDLGQELTQDFYPDLHKYNQGVLHGTHNKNNR